MLSSDPKLPQLSEFEARDGVVPVSFYRRFQERFYTLWRELARNDEQLRGQFASGTYTPTLTVVTNGAASTINQAQWMRVGSVVTVSGSGSFDPTAAAFSNFGLSLPIASNFTSASNLQGAGTAFNLSSSAIREPMAVYADTTNDRAFLNFVAATNDNHEFSFVFTYLIL